MYVAEKGCKSLENTNGVILNVNTVISQIEKRKSPPHPSSLPAKERGRVRVNSRVVDFRKVLF